MKTSSLIRFAWSMVGLAILTQRLTAQVQIFEEGSWPGFPRGAARDVAVSGDYAYAVYGEAGLKVIDISNPRDPKAVGQLDTTGSAVAIAVSGPYAFVAGQREGLQVVDISDPENPDPVSNLTNLLADSITIQGTHAYVTHGSVGLIVVDVSNPLNPQKVGTFQFPDRQFSATRAASSGHLVCVAGALGGVAVLDVSDPKKPQILGTHKGIVATAIAISGDYLVVGGEVESQGALAVLDISNPANPTSVSTLQTGGFHRDFAVYGNALFSVGSSSTGLRVFDLSDPALPREAGDYAGYGGSGVALDGNHLLVAASNRGVQVLDVTTPASPELLGTYVSAGSATSLALYGDYAFLADSTALEIIDISDPSRPNRAKSVNTFARRVTIDAAYAYVLAADLEIFDISSPADPKRIGTYASPRVISAFDVAGPYGYAGTDQGIEIVDLSTPSTPQKVGAFAVEHVQAVSVTGNYLFVYALEEDAVLIIDVSDVANPRKACTFKPSGFVHEIVISGDKAYLCESSVISETYPATNFEIFDVADPANPRWVGAHRSYATSFSMAVLHNYAFPAAGALQVVDVSEPANPRLVGQTTDDDVAGVAVRDNRVFVAAGAHGLRILKLRPFVKSISRQGDLLKIDWEGFGPSHLETNCNPDARSWEPIPGTGGTNTILLPMTAPAGYFRVVEN